jgi:uncharacterized membrane protein
VTDLPQTAARSAPQGPVEAIAAPQRWRDALRAPVAPVACWLGLLAGWVSVFPTLLPRAGWAQGVITAVSVSVWLVVGAVLAWVARVGWGLAGRPVPTVLPYGRRIFAAVAGIVVVVALGAWATWQNEQRRGIGMSTISPAQILVVVVVAALVGAVLFVVGRTLAWAVRRLDRRITRYVPRWAAVAITVVVVVVGGVVLTRDVVARELLDRVNESFSTFDDETPPGIAQPTSPLRSGGPGSEAAWDTLGYEGRNFTGGGPTVADLQAFAAPGVTAQEPIRVYAGLQSADGFEAQAQLAVEELERTGAFDRSVLVVATVTGTGWVDPVSAAAVEYLNAGDTAIVASQYSYLPSWISFLVDLDKAAESSEALNDAVIARWSQLPEDQRPRLVQFGLSLGSYGSEATFATGDAESSIAAATAAVDAVLWAGPTFANPIWGKVLDERTGGSPVWAPEFDSVTLTGTPGAPPAPGRLSGRPVVYATHPTDPVTWASTASLTAKPPWMDAPTGIGVPEPLLWAPGVTLVQEVFDLMAGFSAAPGYGHNYDPNMADAWTLVAAPDAWSAARTEQLRTVLSAYAEGASSS